MRPLKDPSERADSVLAVHVTKREAEAVHRLAKDSDRSVSRLCGRAIRQYLENVNSAPRGTGTESEDRAAARHDRF